MHSRIDRYRQRAATCAATEYDSAASLQRHNVAATEMRRIVAEPGAVEELLPLLAEPTSARWLAFQLLEHCTLSPEIRERCLAIVREVAAGSGPDALGARHWLRDFTG